MKPKNTFSAVFSTVIMLCFAVIISGCSFPKLKIPRVHKVTVQQGNVVLQEMVDRLKPGMTRSQVAYILGEPVLRNTFNPDRWDYIYSVVVPGYFEQEVRMTLFFENEVLAYFTGDLVPTDADVVGNEANVSSVEVAEQ